MATRIRKKNRLRDYNYATPGFYFVTICVQDRICCFGNVNDSQMILNNSGVITERFWREMPIHYPNVRLDLFVVMPIHVHGIIIIQPVGAPNGRPQEMAGNARPYSLHTIVGSYKNIVTKSIHQSGFVNFSWQKSFYDHIVRKEESLNEIREYIRNNPKQWELDEMNPEYTLN